MKIKIEQSGGFTGIPKSVEIDTNNLPSDIANAVRTIVNKKRSNTTNISAPRGAADYLNYKITIEDGKKNKVIEYNQFNADEELRSLISFVKKNSSIKDNF